LSSRICCGRSANGYCLVGLRLSLSNVVSQVVVSSHSVHLCDRCPVRQLLEWVNETTTMGLANMDVGPVTMV